MKEIKDYYEIVVFTAATKNYADWVLDQIDLFGNISHWLYWNHTDTIDEEEEWRIKDLSKIGWSLKKTIIVDNIAENFGK